MWSTRLLWLAIRGLTWTIIGKLFVWFKLLTHSKRFGGWDRRLAGDVDAACAAILEMGFCGGFWVAAFTDLCLVVGLL